MGKTVSLIAVGSAKLLKERLDRGQGFGDLECQAKAELRLALGSIQGMVSDV